ncbi:hypothetical protein TKK_0018109 [Trichogramma kaykai]|uniref:G-patch domain-containing protein n=1 Tax=Trichogramma kaykai TaxID=54128 RepID=A0ABD2W0R9_9HYME
MSLPTNNYLLALGQVSFKNFVREKNENLSSNDDLKLKHDLDFKGDDAKIAYEEIISLESQTKNSKPKSALQKSDKQILLKPIEKTITTDVNVLFKAVERGDLKFVQEHFSKNNVNIVDPFGWTPLMTAAYSGHKEIVDNLICLGAKLKTKEKSGLTALDLAIKKQYHDIVNMLKQKKYKQTKKQSSNNSLTSENNEKVTDVELYCDLCELNYKESSKAKHDASILHVFNSKPKVKNTFYGISKQNKGYQIMLNTGWDEEGGLGPSGEGQKYPVKTILKRDRKGLGQGKQKDAKVTHFKPGDVNAVKHANFKSNIKKKEFSRKDRERQLSREAAFSKRLRQEL